MEDLVEKIGPETDLFPMLKALWDFYSAKGTKTVFVSIGATTSSCQVDLQIAEALGCPIHLFEPDTTMQKRWEEIKTLLRSRKATEETDPYCLPATKRWLLPKNVQIYPCYLFGLSGTMDLSGGQVKLESVRNFVKGDGNIDILKIDVAEKEAQILSSILEQGFRPSLVLIRWSHSPDEDYRTMISAGSLQMLGYELLEHEGNKCLYHFTGETLFDTCSWLKTDCKNPLILELLKPFIK